MKQSAIKLTDESRENFKNQAEQMQRRRRQWDIVGVVVALLLTYGLVFYFIIETIIKALQE